MHPLLLSFAVVWGVIVGGALIATVLTQPHAAYIPLMMLCFGATLLAVGRFAAKNDNEILTEFLCKGLDAHMVGRRP